MSYFSRQEITYESLLDRKLINPSVSIRNEVQEYGNNLTKQAREAYQKHQIKSESSFSTSGPDRWILARCEDDGRWSGFYLSEIVILRVGVLVCGDVDPVIFEGGYRDNPRNLINWVGTSHIEGYLVNKASQGFRASWDRNPAKTTDDNVAIAEMQYRLLDCFQTLCEESIDAAIEYFKPDFTEEEVKEPTARFDPKTCRIECEDEKLREKIIWTINTRLETDKEIETWVRAIEDVRGGEPLELVRNELYNNLSDADVGDVGELTCDIGVVPAPRLYYAKEACRKLCELLEAREKAGEESAKTEQAL